MPIVTVGIDLAKNVFAIHGVDEAGKAVLIKPRVSRDQLVTLIAQLPPCLMGMEACSGAHHWACVFQQHGHTVKLMAPKLVAPLSHVGQARQERRDGCRRHLRGSHTREHAFRAAEGRTSAGDALPAPEAGVRRGTHCSL